MARFKFHQLHQADAALFLSVPFLDITCFAVFFALAVYWRRKPELHRRFIFIATSALLAAAFGRLPYLDDHSFFYAGVDAVILLGVVRDLLVNRRVHTIYRIALPVLIVLQTCAVYLAFSAPSWWARLAHAIAS
jgi:phosphoglycerol transferase MdoB-like AlkP superfamily enzyme